MNWIVSLVRIVGTTSPFFAWAVQLSAELDSRGIQARLRRLADPIGSQHPDVPAVAEYMYGAIPRTGESRVELAADVADRYSRALAILDTGGWLKASRTLFTRTPTEFWLTNASFVLYMAGLYEDADLMERIVAYSDSAPRGQWLHGSELAEEYALPLPVIRAFFQLLEQRGLGFLSKEVGTTNYYVRA